MTGTPGTRGFEQHPQPRAQWPVFVGKRPDAELACSPDLSAAEQLRLARHHRPRVRAVLAGNRSIDPDVQRILAQDRDAVMALAWNPGLCQEVQLLLLRTGEARVVRAVASSAVLAPAVRDALAGEPRFRPALARNPHLPGELYVHLQQHGDAAVRLALAGNPAAGAQALTAAASSRRDEERLRAAGNPSLPAAAQRRLARDQEVGVRQRLAGNPGLVEELQVALAQDTPGVLLMLGRNPALTPDAVDALLAVPAGLASGVAAHPRLSPAQQRLLARELSPGLLGSLAANPCLCPDLQQRFSANTDRGLRFALARNPSLVGEVQLRLAAEGDSSLRSVLVANPALDRPVLRVLLDARAAGRWRWHPDDTPRVPALGLATHWTPASLDHPVLGPLVALFTGKPGVLTAAAGHPDPLVRWALVGNDRVGAQRLGGLLTDPEPGIAAGARARFVAGLAG